VLLQALHESRHLDRMTRGALAQFLQRGTLERTGQ